MLLSKDSSDKIVNVACLPKLQPLQPLFCTCVTALGDFRQQQATTVSVEDGPGLVTTDGSLKALYPSRCAAGDNATWDG